MALSKNLANYEDIRTVFAAALQAGLPSTYTLASPQAAIRWRARAYHFRALTSSTEFQSVNMRIERDSPCEIILFHEELGTLRSSSGEEIPLTTLSPEEREAERLRKELGL
jgi:hypothetical protein